MGEMKKKTRARETREGRGSLPRVSRVARVSLARVFFSFRPFIS